MKYLRLFQTVAEKEAATLDYPNVNYTIENDSLEIIAEDPTPAFGGLTVKDNILDATQEGALFNGGGGSSTSSSTSGSGSGSGGGGALPSKMYVDGVEEVVINTWRFKTAGEHIVQYEFADNVIPGGFLINNPIYTEVIVGDDIIEIGQEVFYNVNGEGILTSATIGTGIGSIGQQAFSGNINMTSVTVKATTPPTLGPGVFNRSNDCPIYVHASAVATYKAATGWSEYASRIFAIQ